MMNSISIIVHSKNLSAAWTKIWESNLTNPLNYWSNKFDGHFCQQAHHSIHEELKNEFAD